jgi:para-nitrobenzyl esterase
MTKWSGWALAAGLLMASGAAVAQESPVVSVTGGMVRGGAEKGALLFRAIPYAAPPLAALRWQPPAPVVAWTGTRDATQYAPSCPQNSEGWNTGDAARFSEDCLTVSVRTPSLSGKRPVMVWIHGGSNRAGSGTGAAEIAFDQRGLVVVGLNYRLGLLGFLAHRGLAAEQGGTSGNYGLMDQIAALRWVKENIARFGGDPEKVTIFGESAGSQDVSLLLAAPATRGLFRGAILQSGTPGFGMSFRPLKDALALGDQLQDLAGVKGIADLRNLPLARVLELQKQVQEPESQGNAFLFLRATVDGKVFPETPDKLLAKAPPLPVIIGTDKIEFGPGNGGVNLDYFSRYWFGDNGPKALAAYRAEEAAGADPRRGNLELRMQSDAQFHCPANRLADLLMAKGWPVWRYEFDVGPDGGLTRHAYEVGLVFGGADTGGIKMLDYWSAFGLAGDPNTPIAGKAAGPNWPRFDAANPQMLDINAKATVAAKGPPRQQFCGYSNHF